MHQPLCCCALYFHPDNAEYTYIHAAVTVYVLEGTPPGRIYQVDAADPESAQLKVSCVKQKTPEMMQSALSEMWITIIF